VKPDFLELSVELMESQKNSNSKFFIYEDNTTICWASPINPITSRGRHYGYRNRYWTIG
jgi:hypothetical protein